MGPVFDRSLELFCIDPSAANGKPAEQRPTSPSANKSAVRILDLRRVQNVAIGLSRFYKRLTDHEIIEAIINGHFTVLSLDDLLTVKPLMPTTEERQLLVLYRGPIDDLGTAEKFMLMAAKEPHLLWMVDSMIFERQFDSEVDSLTSKLMLIVGLLTKIRESPSLKTLLKSVLELGNLANYDYGHQPVHSRVRGKALGFKLDSWMKLQEVKSVDRKTNLLQYLVMTLEEHNPDVLSLPADFADLNIVRHWDTSAIFAHIEEVNTTYRKICDLQLSEDEPTRGEASRFAQKVFIAKAASELEKLDKLATLLKESWKKTGEYLGEDDRRPEEIFQILDQFFKALSSCILSAGGSSKERCNKPSNVSSGDLEVFKRPNAHTNKHDDESSTLSSEYSQLTRSESSLSMRSNPNPNKL